MRKAVFSIPFVVVLLAVAVIGEAQQPAKVAKIGWLSIGLDYGPGSTIRGLPPELRALGYVEGMNIVFDYRYADNKLDRLPALADELVRLKVDVLVTPGTPAAIAAKNATRTIPIVFFRVSDPVPLGLVDTLSRPGGNVTGFTEISEVLAGKRLALFK
jgi:putative ABC transport system substrate-binding protein